MFTKKEAQISKAYRALHGISLLPGRSFCYVQTAEDERVIADLQERLEPSIFRAVAHSCIDAEREFLMGDFTAEEFNAIYGDDEMEECA